MNTILAEQLKSKVTKHEPIKILDVRTPVEYREFHLKNAINIQLDKLSEESLHAAGFVKSELLYVVCKSGSRAKNATQQLSSIGYQAVCVDGGTLACKDCGMDIECSGKKAISIERQVRIAAGSLVLFGVVLSLGISTSFLFIPMFVGVGLVFSGFADWCGMALLLAKMPWNK